MPLSPRRKRTLRRGSRPSSTPSSLSGRSSPSASLCCSLQSSALPFSTELLCPLKATFQMPELLRPILHAMLTVSGNRVSRQWHRLSLGLSARFAEFAVPGLLCQVSCGICPLCLQGQKGGTALDRVLRECATDPLISQTMFCVSDSVFGQSSCGIRDCFARGVSRVRASCTVPRLRVRFFGFA